MSCPSCGSSFGCGCYGDCVTDTIQDCEHTDPGIEVSGASLAVYDYLFNERRLQNAPGFLINQLAGGGYKISWTLDPAVAHTQLNLALNQTFTGLLAATGTAGNYRRLTPTTLGYLQANADGTWQLVALPAQAVPDPLVLTTLNASNVVTDNLTVNGLTIFSALANDTITQNIGLNAGNELVIGGVAQGSVAKFHESITENSASQPNADLHAGDFIKFASEIYDADHIASPVSSQRIKIDVAGTYVVQWGVGFGPAGQGTSGPWTPVVQLQWNGSPVSYGNNRHATYDTNKSCVSGGAYVGAFAVNDYFEMKLTGSMPPNASNNASGVADANMVLTRIK